MKREEITVSMVQKKFDEVLVLLEKVNEDGNDDISELAIGICFDVVNYCSHNRCEAMGILQEAMFRYREITKETDEENRNIDPEDIPDDCLCDECRERREKERKEKGENGGNGNITN